MRSGRRGGVTGEVGGDVGLVGGGSEEVLAGKGTVDESAGASVDPFEAVGVWPQMDGVGDAVAYWVGVYVAARGEADGVVGNSDGVVAACKEGAGVA